MKTKIAIAAAAVVLFSAHAPTRVSADKLDELERKIGVLADEMERLKLGEAAEPDLKSISGFGPAASKVYQKGAKQLRNRGSNSR